MKTLESVVSAEIMTLGIQISAEEGAAPQELVLPFKRVGNEWKIDLKLF